MEMNKIIHGDFVELIKEVPDESVDLVVTDPPYGMSFQSNYRKEKYQTIKMDKSMYWYPYLIHHLHRILKKDTHCYIFCSFHNIDYFVSEAKKYFIVKNLLVWEKNNTSMGDLECDYAPKYELILFLQKGKKPLNGGRDPNILKFKRTGNKIHPTQKPTELIRYLIEKSSKESDVVIDPFVGSGTTAEACKNIGREFIAFEIEKEYVDVANSRLQQDTLLGLVNN